MNESSDTGSREELDLPDDDGEDDSDPQCPLQPTREREWVPLVGGGRGWCIKTGDETSQVLVVRIFHVFLLWTHRQFIGTLLNIIYVYCAVYDWSL